MCVRAHLFIRYVILIGRRETELSRTRRTMSYFFPVSDSSLAISSLHRQSAYLGPCACARKDCMRVRCLVCMPRGSERSSNTRLRRVGTGPTDDRIFRINSHPRTAKCTANHFKGPCGCLQTMWVVVARIYHWRSWLYNRAVVPTPAKLYVFSGPA